MPKLIFPRVAQNFAKNGYFPTDEGTLERLLPALCASSSTMQIVDTCAGEGVAIAEVAHVLGRDRTRVYTVEYNKERAGHARTLSDHCIHGDFNDTMISREFAGFLYLNPPYGDLVGDEMSTTAKQSGRARLEKAFYQRSLPLLQQDGILAFVIPFYSLDAELVGSLTRCFTDLRVFRAVDDAYRQVVLLGRRIKHVDQIPAVARATRDFLMRIGRGEVSAPELPSPWTDPQYIVPAALAEPKHFFRITLELEQFASEVNRLQGLWNVSQLYLGAAQRSQRRPACALSRWHLALALAAGAISGVVKSPGGRVLAVKGDTHKQRWLQQEFTEDENGAVTEVRTLTDYFVPTIRAWELTPGASSLGQLITIQ